MRIQTAEAIILRTYRYGEADRIVVFLTEDRGKKRGVAKNATKSRRRFGGALEPLTRGRVAFAEREHRELVRIDRIDAARTPLRAAVGRPNADGAHVLGHASYFAELLDEWSPDGQTNEKLFRLGAAIGEALCRGGSVEALARYFEYWLLRLEGVYPALEQCPRCLQTTLGRGAVLASDDWTYICGDCSNVEPQLSAAAMTFLKSAAGRTPADISDTGAPSGALREIERVHHRLISVHLDKELRSARVVRELRPHS